MTYTDTEQSVALARPVLLLDLADDFGNHWRYSSGPADVSFGGFTYTADACRMGAPEISGNSFRNRLGITLSRQNAFSLQYVSGPLESAVTVTLYRVLGGDSVVLWDGYLQEIVHDGDAVPTLQCVPRTSSMGRVGTRRICQILCDLPLYSTGIGECQIDKENYKMTGIIDSVDGKTMVSSSFSDHTEGWLDGGELVVGNAHRLIVVHTVYSAGGGEVQLNRAILSPETNSAGQIEFTAYAGCDHTASTCRSKFSNGPNYGGQEYLPTKNPFKGEGLL